ncbi:TPA: hypothetical protein ACPSKB_000816 [Legionella feeleii]
MPLNVKNIDLLIQFSILAAGEEDDPMDRQLGPIHIIKYVYLADLYYSKFNHGETYSGADWSFYKFGPWSQEVHARIEPALSIIHANKKSFTSDFEDKEDWVRWDLQDDDLFLEKQKQLPSGLASNLKQVIHKFGKDTPSLLDFVYKTTPMLHAAPNERLNFSLEILESHQIVKPPMEPKERTKKEDKKFKQEMKILREKYQKNKIKKANLINPVPFPRYDEVYAKGIEWLDSLAGVPFISTEIDVEFSSEVWKSSSRRNDDFS